TGCTGQPSDTRRPLATTAMNGRLVLWGCIRTQTPCAARCLAVRPRAWTMPDTAIHQSDQLNSAISNAPPPMRTRSAVPTLKLEFVMPVADADSRARATLAGSGSIATTLDASDAY